MTVMPEKFVGLPNGIPALEELMGMTQWVAWKYEYRNGPDKKPTKPPVSPRSGFGASHSDPKTWGTYQEAVQMAVRRQLPGVGFVLSPDDDFTGIDLDDCVGPEGDLEPWAQDIVDLSETYCEVSPSGNGLRLIARGKIDKTIKNDSAHVEIYRDSRYLTITGARYGNCPAEIRPAPITIERLLERAGKPEKKEAEVSAPLVNRVAASGSGDFFSNVNRRALECLSLWVGQIFPSAKFQQSTGAYRVSSRDLGRDLEEDLSIAPNGIKDWGVHDMGDPRDGARTAIDIAIEFGGAPDARQAAFWLCEKMGIPPENMGWSDYPSPINDGYDASVLLGDDNADLDDEEPIGGAAEHFDIPDEMLRPEGVVGEIADWICDWTSEPIRIHAVGAALVIIGTLIGRKVYSKSRPTSTALYVGAVTPSGFGKQHAQDAIKIALDEVVSGGRLHTGWNVSLPAIALSLNEQASKVMIADEFADKLIGIRSRNASTSQTAISEGLRTLWGINIGSYSPDVSISRGDIKIQRPCMSFFGASTQKDFVRSLTSKDITNGLFNRFLILPRFGMVETRPERDDIMTLPDQLRQRLGWLYNCLPDPMQITLAMRGDGYPQDPILVPFSDDAAALNEENKRHQKEMMLASDDDDVLALYGRYAEQIKRIALIVSCGRHADRARSSVISAPDMEFARKLVEFSINQFVLMVRRDMVENWIEGNRQTVLGVIRKAKEISRSELLRKVRSIQKRDLDQIIELLKEAHCILEVPQSGTGGRNGKKYRFIRD